MLRQAVCTPLVLGGLSPVSILPAVAASFDCSKAATPFETAICSDDELSRADERLATTYATAIGGLSEFALGEMRVGRYSAEGIRCLKNLFDSRSRVLETSRMIDGLRVYPLARYEALPDPNEADEPNSSWAVATHELAVVQIDANEGFAHAFNDLVREQGQFISGDFSGQGGPERMEEDSSSDTVNSITIDEVAGSNRISLRASTYWYGHGAAHGNYTRFFYHYLREEGRFLEARDLFARKGWQRALLDLTVEAAREEHGDNLMLDDTKYIEKSVIDPARWHLSDPYGLVIQFQPYEISAYAYGAPTARVSWPALEPYLAESAHRMRYGY